MPKKSGSAVLGAIAAGGALGAPARFAASQLIHVTPDGFPWATFTINVVGSFALGIVLRCVKGRGHLLPFMTTGFLGAFTTFSTFAVDTDVLFKDGHPALAATYCVTSVGLGLAAVRSGLGVGARLASG